MNFGKAVIVGRLKNSAAYIPDVIKNLENIASLYNDSALIFIESDSINDTKHLIKS